MHKKGRLLHTYQAASSANSVTSFSSELAAICFAASFSSVLVSICSNAAFSSAFVAAHCSSSPNEASTGLVHFLAMCPRVPHFLHLRCLFTRPSSPLLILFFLGLPSGLVSTGALSLNPGSTMFHWYFPKSAGTLE